MRLIAVLSLVLAFVSGTGARADEPAPAPPVTLTADVVALDLANGTSEATGNASLTYENATLHAQRIAANRGTGELRAEGKLRLTQEGRLLTGETLEYSLSRQEGTLTQARVQEQGVIIQGERIEFSPQRLTAYNALLTTCDRPEPDYAFAASQITLTATATGPKGQPVGGRLTLRRARVMFHGRTLLRLPNYSTTVGEIQQRRISLLPVVGYSRLDGPYAAYGYSFGRPDRGIATDLEWRLTSKRGVRWYAETHAPAGPARAYLRYSDREEVSETETSADEITVGLAKVLVDRKPEIGVRLRDYPLRRGLRFTAQASAGRYVEHEVGGPEARSASRLSALGLVSTDPRPLSRRASLSHALGLRVSSYSAGDTLGVLYMRHTISYAASRDTSLALSYVRRDSTGETPFRFDEVDIAQELRSDLHLRLSPKWSVRVMDLYDLQAHSHRDLLLAATRTAHCLDYTVGWRKLRDTFFVGITLAPGPEAPRTFGAAGASDGEGTNHR